MKVAFIDRDGTLIFEPPDTKRIDSLVELKILPCVIDGLKNLQTQGYKLVMVSNQDGIGTKNFPKKKFKEPQKKLLKILKNEGVNFYKIFICPHTEEDKCACRKPKTGLVKNFLKDGSVDLQQSIMVGDRKTDQEFAKKIGVTGIQMITNGSFPRIASLKRTTNETDIFALVNLDGTGQFKINTGLKLFDHMLEQFAKQSLVDLTLKAKGDLERDEHHTIEDTAITLGEALSRGLGKRAGIRRYGFLLPMDDTLVEVAIDLGGRPYLVFDCKFNREKVGDLPTEMIEHFFKSLSDALRANICISVRYSKNEHHKIEAIFKACARAFRAACEQDQRIKDFLPTTKGIL